MSDTRSRTFFVLALDGGGVRGIYAAHVLTRIQEEFGVSFHEHFDLIAGTSTGSITAAALAMGEPAKRICDLYESEARSIFSRRRFGRGILRSLYGKSALREALSRVLGNRILSDAKTRLIIPATDISNGTVHVFKSPYDSSFVRDKNVRAADAVLASCSAPVYFDPEVVNEYFVADGGLWANNPSLVALVETMGKLAVPRDQIKVLSFGTGTGDHRYSLTQRSQPWGILGWGPRRFIDLILSLQSRASTNMVSLLLPESRRFRMDYALTGEARLDDCSVIADVKAQADHDFTHKSKDLRTFLEI